MLGLLVKLAALGVLTGSTVNIGQGVAPLLLPPLSEATISNARKGTPETLATLSRFELVRLWHSLPPPTTTGLIAGYYQGTVLPAGPLAPVSSFVTHRLFGPGKWAGKNFKIGGKAGNNVFVLRDQSRALRGSREFALSLQSSLLDRRPCCALDYGDKCGNQFPWCGMRDELREVKPGLLLGLGSMTAFGGPLNSAVFTLQKKRAHKWSGALGKAYN
jgi:hypothetical protein